MAQPVQMRHGFVHAVGVVGQDVQTTGWATIDVVHHGDRHPLTFEGMAQLCHPRRTEIHDEQAHHAHLHAKLEGPCIERSVVVQTQHFNGKSVCLRFIQSPGEDGGR